MYRQNTVLNDFINFLKARGRFRDIEFIENSVHATPRIPDFPSLIFYIEEVRSEQQYILEIHGNESAVMNREIQEFFGLNQLTITKVKTKIFLQTINGDPLTIEIEGMGESYENLLGIIWTLVEEHQYSVVKTQKTLIFSKARPESMGVQKGPSQHVKKSPTKKQETPSHVSRPMQISSVKLKQEAKDSLHARVSPKKAKFPSNDIKPNSKIMDQDSRINSHTQEFYTDVENEGETRIKPHTSEKTFEDKSGNDNLFMEERDSEFSEDKLNQEEPDIDLFREPVSRKDFSDDVTPYLKQSTSLFRRDNWEQDLPTEFEMEILERTYSRIKHRTKPEILAKDLDLPVDEAEQHLRSLISKGLLRTQVGWYIIKKSHLPFFKRTFAEGEKKKRKKKSPRISRVGEGLTPEEIATIKAIKSRPNLKAQSNLLTRPTGLKQSVLKEVLRNLVDKGILRVSYGWYILKDKHILEHKRGVLSGGQPVESAQYDIPNELDLTPEEIKVIQALLQRPQNKAQSNLLAPEVKLPKEQIKQVLRELVEKNICKVTYGWYQLKDPEKFLLK